MLVKGSSSEFATPSKKKTEIETNASPAAAAAAQDGGRPASCMASPEVVTVED
jgi:hypothetical protein